jgi:thiol-disulfide isomerase/thioredoxin
MFALGLLSSLVGCAGASSAPAESPSNRHPLVGVHAPSFSRPGVANASALSTEQSKGKVVIVDFWATYCVPCEKEFPELQALSDRYRGQVVVLGLSEDDSLDGVANFVKKTGARFPIAWDEGNTIGLRYKLEKMPTSYVVDKRGVIRFVHSGYQDGVEEKIAHEVEGLLH